MDVSGVPTVKTTETPEEAKAGQKRPREESNDNSAGDKSTANGTANSEDHPSKKVDTKDA